MHQKMLKIFCPSLIATILLAGCATTSNAPANCPKTVGGYKAGETTSQLVQSCLGSPFHENHNLDGRYVYLYKIDTATTIAFLFDTSGKLIRTQGYKQN